MIQKTTPPPALLEGISPMVELTEELPPGPLVNQDLAPTRLEGRTWNLWHIASLWVG